MADKKRSTTATAAIWICEKAMRKCAIVSAGPSVVNTWHGNDGQYASVFAVNNASVFYEHDIAVALDGFFWRDRSTRAPSHGLVYRSDLADIFHPSEHPLFQSCHHYDACQIAESLGVARCAMSFSLCAAIYAAVYLGFDAIDLFGHDMDFHRAGLGTDHIYHRDRWAHEAKLYARCMAFCDSRGVELIRKKE